MSTERLGGERPPEPSSEHVRAMRLRPNPDANPVRRCLCPVRERSHNCGPKPNCAGYGCSSVPRHWSRRPRSRRSWIDLLTGRTACSPTAHHVCRSPSAGDETAIASIALPPPPRDRDRPPRPAPHRSGRPRCEPFPDSRETDRAYVLGVTHRRVARRGRRPLTRRRRRDGARGVHARRGATSRRRCVRSLAARERRRAVPARADARLLSLPLRRDRREREAGA